MSTQTVPSIESFLAAVAAAEQRLADGEAKARQAKALLLQAEKARDEASARKAAAEQQLAAVEAAVKKAHVLRALLGDDLVSQGEALLEQSWAEAQAELTRLQAEAEAAQAEVERLLATPEAQAYLDYRKAQEEARQEEQTRARQELEARLIALRPGAAVGQGAEALTALAAEADKAGFPDLAAQARDAAEAAQRVAQAQVQAAAALRKRRLIRWADGRAALAQPGDFVFVLQNDGGDGSSEPDGNTDGAGAAIHLRPLPAHSGRLRFQVVAVHSAENIPPEYGDVPARGRVWRWKNPPAGERDGLNEAQAQVVAEIVRGKLRCGWAINRANARLARQVARERAATREAQHADEQAGIAPVTSPAAIETPAPISPSAPGASDLDGLPPQVAARLRRVGLGTRQAVEQMLADEAAFLSLPGIGQATLAAVRAWLSAPACLRRQALADLADTETGAEVEVETEVEVESPVAPSAEEQPVTVEPSDVAPAIAGLAALAAAFDAPLAAGAVCEDAPAQYQPQPATPEPVITVEGDDVDGLRLAQWQGVARVGLTPVAQRLGLEEVQVLVHENEGQSTLVAYWPGGETTVSCPSDGRAGQMRAVRELVQRIRAAV